jgi:hypothetical protein
MTRENKMSFIETNFSRQANLCSGIVVLAALTAAASIFLQLIFR